MVGVIENKNVIQSSEFENVRRRRMREKDIEESKKYPKHTNMKLMRL